ncbi:DeoR/GlpR family DNA-binding transcription regulator [Halomonas saccharevitans]|uniref:DeoR/GlpR family DNA-binding transcription regulator n=1 Tax=Halomonas saccharevitans TaxID=416872 RepID=A0A1I7CHY2_9GAMM|nr:DeoR/GlpR family DNA-binding transcription regulator [Halomonas saccharevitans]MDT8878818.1 DeoR/GlpR family DNA-binding transcription regulator [Halomonas saccharevitans]SFT99043.1 transcriptional regulator, DeoR family [Halomonas saccharevitans]
MNERSVRRLARLSEALAHGGSLRLSEAAVLCGVSAMTIRRDLAAAESGLQLMGGHLVRSDDPRYAPVYDLDAQQDRHAAAKRRLCRRALERIAPGDTLFIDCGTTLMPLAAGLPHDQSLTVVTYALNVAEAVSLLPGVRLILLGGLYHGSSRSFADDEVDAAIRRLGINQAFLSAAGVHERQGLSCFHFHEVAPKQAAIATAARRLLVVDESKLGVIRPMRFAGLDDIDEIISDGEGARRLAAGEPARP